MGAEKYRLTDEETKECIENIMIELSAKAEPSKKPRIIFVVGQPGAGKTGLAALTKRECNQEGESILAVNSDMVATYHKYYRQTLELLPEERYAVTREFVNPALDIIYQELMKRKINQVVESTFANKEKYEKLMLMAKKYGYEIDVNVIAVDKYESLVSCYERELGMMKLGLQPRGIDRENHDKPYENMLKTINSLQFYCDNINVYARGELEENPLKICSSKENGVNVCQSIERVRKLEHANIVENWKEYIGRIDILKSRIQVYGKNEKLVENSLLGLDQIKSEMQAEILDELYL